MNNHSMERKKSYVIHGENLIFSCPDSVIWSPIHRFIRYFEYPEKFTLSPLSISFLSVPDRQTIPVSIPPAVFRIESHTQQVLAGDLLSAWKCDVYTFEGKLFVDLQGNGVLVINNQEGTAQGFFINPENHHPDILVSYFHFVLSELLKRQGLYTIHATALEKGGCGILIPAFSGGGKTTACISLLRSGYRCISDDHPLLRVAGDSLELLAFPEKVDVTENAIKFFPELEAGKDKLHQGLLKRYFYIKDFYHDGIGHVCEPKVVVFPQVVDSPTSKVELVSKRQAFEEILPHSLLVYDKNIARKEFQALYQLIQTTDSYRLYFGRDILKLHSLIDPLLS